MFGVNPPNKKGYHPTGEDRLEFYAVVKSDESADSFVFESSSVFVGDDMSRADRGATERHLDSEPKCPYGPVLYGPYKAVVSLGWSNET